MQGILGEKVGMTAIFAEDGRQVPVTVIRVAGNQVCGTRTQERDGYSALIMGFGEKRVSRATRPERGFFAAAGLVATNEEGREVVKRHLREIRLPADVVAGYTVGETVAASRFLRAGGKVDVIGTSKGRGFTGVMRRHNFRGTKATHGVHEYFRHGGAISSNTYPARVFKNKKMPGQHGNRRTTVQNISIVEILDSEGLILLRGGVPGPNGGLVMIKQAVKGRH
ncbi:MAG: 50S ribosomal protein L3 [bacterium]